MRIYAYSLLTFGSGQIRIGRQGENLCTRIDVDVTPWKTEYPNGTISLFVVPPEGNGYLAAIEGNGNTIRWTIRDTDTAYDGNGKAELILKDARGTVMKSVTANTICVKSVSAAEPADPPEAIRPWVEQILDAIASGGVGSGGGAPGVGISRLEQTTASSDDGGVNVWTATLTDGSTYQFEVRNGQRGSIGPKGEKGDTGATGPQGPAGADGKDYVLTDADKQEIAGMIEVTVGAAIDDTAASSTTTYSSSKIESELTSLNTANAAQDKEIAKKANDADLAKVAKSGSYTDLTGKPTIPTVPSALPNPNKLILSGAVTAEYDGSSEVRVEIPAGGSVSYTLPIASATQLGGVMPVAKTDEMTQSVGVDEAGGLWAMVGSGSSGGTANGSPEYELIADLTLEENVSSFQVDVDEKYKHLFFVAEGLYAEGSSGFTYISTKNGWKLIQTNKLFSNNKKVVFGYLRIMNGKIIGYNSNRDSGMAVHGTANSDADILYCQNNHSSGFGYIKFDVATSGYAFAAGFNLKVWGCE